MSDAISQSSSGAVGGSATNPERAAGPGQDAEAKLPNWRLLVLGTSGLLVINLVASLLLPGTVIGWVQLVFLLGAATLAAFAFWLTPQSAEGVAVRQAHQETTSPTAQAVMVTMPDGTRQMVVIAPPVVAQKAPNPAGLVGFILGLAAVASLGLGMALQPRSYFDSSTVATAFGLAAIALGIAAIPVSAIGLRAATRQGAGLKGLAITGLVLGILVSAVFLIAVIFLGALLGAII